VQIESTVGILPVELAQVVQSVFRTMIGLEVSEGGESWFPYHRNRLMAAVHLSGHWNGVVVLECDEDQARRFARKFLETARPETVYDVVRDVFGELANMIGGNMKSILSGGIQLSLPCVVDGSDYTMRISGAEVRERLAFRSPEGTFWVSVLVMREPRVSAVNQTTGNVTVS